MIKNLVLAKKIAPLPFLESNCEWFGLHSEDTISAFRSRQMKKSVFRYGAICMTSEDWVLYNRYMELSANDIDYVEVANIFYANRIFYVAFSTVLMKKATIEHLNLHVLEEKKF